MKIRRRLGLNAWISVVALVLMIVTLAWTFWEGHRADQNSRLTDEIRKVVSERVLVRDDYLLNPSEQAKNKWYEMSETIRALLESAAERFTGTEDRALLQEARKSLDVGLSSFSVILEKDQQKEYVDRKKFAFSEAEATLIGQVFVSAFTLNNSIVRLSEISDRAAITTRNRGFIFIFLFIVGSAIAITANSIFIRRIVSKRLTALNEGVAIIGDGNLDYHIDAAGDDELSSLARASNEMVLKLKAAQEYARSLIEASLDPLVTISALGKITDVNEASVQATGVVRSQLIGSDFSDYFTEPDKARGGYQKVFSEGFVRDYPLAIRHITGRIIDVLYNASIYKDNKGNVLGVFAAARDITERKQIESIGRLATVVRDSNDAITIQDYDGNIIAWNHGAELMFGYSEQEALQMTIWQLAPPDKAEEQRDFNRRLFAGESVSSFETQRLTKDGRLLDVWLTVTKMVNDEGKVIGIAATERDISERKKAEFDLRRSNDDLQQFANVASHDLQEPLRMIVSYLQLIEQRYKGRLDKDADDFINFAVDGGTRMQGLINGLLAFSRVESRSKPRERMDTEAILRDSLANIELIIAENKADVTYDPLPPVMFDPSQLIQIFQNLIVNAIKFHGEEAPRIHLAAEKKGRKWVFSVKDNGIGIDPQYKDKVFILFHRLGGIKYHGSGVGLSVCKRIVERHGGRIWYESEPGKGTTFYFTVPG